MALPEDDVTAAGAGAANSAAVGEETAETVAPAEMAGATVAAEAAVVEGMAVGAPGTFAAFT